MPSRVFLRNYQAFNLSNLSLLTTVTHKWNSIALHTENKAVFENRVSKSQEASTDLSVQPQGSLHGFPFGDEVGWANVKVVLNK